jgi:sialate O-acetylesterase
MRALIDGWRKQFGVPVAPFLFVQLAPYKYGGKLQDGDLPGIWAAQQAALEIPHTGMAVTNDIGNPGNIHPGNKSEVARRLSLWALADTYGRKDLVKSGPLFRAAAFEGGRVQVKFDHVGGGLATRDGKAPTHFEVAADDGAFQPAVAEISPDGQGLTLSSPAVAAPTQARFAWSQVAEPNLMNREGLPAGAFHSRPDAKAAAQPAAAGK